MDLLVGVLVFLGCEGGDLVFLGCEVGNLVFLGRVLVEVFNFWEFKVCFVFVGVIIIVELLFWEIVGVLKGVKGVEIEFKRIIDVRMVGDLL